MACAYLELSTPDLTTAVRDMVGCGVQAVTVVPMFLGVGKHAREDLPQLLANLRKMYSDVQFTLQSAVGEDPRLVHLLAEIALSDS